MRTSSWLWLISWIDCFRYLTLISYSSNNTFQNDYYKIISWSQQEQNPFLQHTSDVDTLVKYTSPAVNQMKHMSSKSGSERQAPPPPHLMHQSSVPVFDDLYRDSKPALPLHRCQYGSLTDPLHRHGAQLLELKAMEKKGVLTFWKMMFQSEIFVFISKIKIFSNLIMVLCIVTSAPFKVCIVDQN